MPDKEHTAQIGVALPLTLLNEIQQYCQENGITKSALVRIAISKFLNNTK